jgi:hypothetical protein
MKTLLRRLLFVFLGFIGLVVLFYAEEDLRGWHAWQKCKREFAAKGEVLDWNAYIPPPVPDDQNFFAAPKMQEWFVRNLKSTSDLAKRLANPRTSAIGTTNAIVSEKEAGDYLTWSDQFAPDFNLMREALKRPFARMDGDYHDPVAMPIPNFVAVRIVAQTLAQRAHCHLILNQPESALDDLTLLHDMCRLMQAAPTGKPMTLVAAMINVAVAGLYVDTIAGGLQSHAWQEPQLTALQKQCADINLTPFVLQALRGEPAGLCRTVEIAWIPKLFDMTGKMKWSDKVRWWFWPRGWTYQNMVNVAVLELKPLNGFDLAHDTIAPRRFAEASREVDKFFRHKSPYKLLAAIAIPNFSKAWQTTAHNQTMANEAQIVCALERYHLAHGEYPATLDALSPQFVEKIPHDLVGGEPLIYRPTADGKFLLYSIGWNEKDDGGQDVSAKTPNGGIDFTKGDWVWKD